MAIQIQNIPFYPIELEKPLVDSSINWTSQPNLKSVMPLKLK